MLGAIRLYWWMGVIGAVVQSAITVGVCLAGIFAPNSSPVEAAMGGLLFGFMSVTPFVCSIRLANQLAARPQGLLPRARVIGIILATAWFPWLTLPGIICVRRVTRYHAAYCTTFFEDR